ncbi:hypothetical protein Cni_G13330 [Canna indica]|uniref:Uncharacterized protein n=1 Tax=Canna indica TaxID=4628 RepID=A0AAQ3K9C0_9LILI|nr:hypothetical protein Cni_G13330 [Canna indica]
MGNSVQCCLACILPCGAFDVVRIVHLSGQVEEYSHRLAAGEILAANPNHILSKPCSQGGGRPRYITITSPKSELKRGHIYFLLPTSTSALPKQKSQKRNKSANHTSSSRSGHRHRRSTQVGVWRPQLESIREDP